MVFILRFTPICIHHLALLFFKRCFLSHLESILILILRGTPAPMIMYDYETTVRSGLKSTKVWTWNKCLAPPNKNVLQFRRDCFAFGKCVLWAATFACLLAYAAAVLSCWIFWRICIFLSHPNFIPCGGELYAYCFGYKMASVIPCIIYNVVYEEGKSFNDNRSIESLV